MTRRHIFAVAVAVITMFLALAQPLWVRTTGDEVTLALQPVDPLSLFRGNYVDLRYDVSVVAPADADWNDLIYVVFNNDRPATALRSSVSRPTLEADETCIRGRLRGTGNVEFPDLEQYFVTAEQGRELERDLGNMVGVVRATSGCRAILVAIEPT